MRTLNDWFQEYGESHRNKTNKMIHYICVPTIFFNIVGLLMSIPATFLENLTGYHNPLVVNWATIALIFMLLFYVRLSFTVALEVVLFGVLCIGLNYFIGQHVSLWLFSTVVFVLAWIGQFYGHHVEGKKPSFLKDLQFLLIGPAWIFHQWAGGIITKA